MDKQKLQQDIDELKAKLAEMESELNKPELVINYWQPGHNEKYYNVNSLGIVEISCVLSSTTRYRTFKTQEQAQEYAEYVKAEETLKAEIARLNEGWWPDWNDRGTTKYVVALNTEFGSLKRRLYHYTKFSPSFMYLKSGELTEQLIKTHSKELKTYLSY